MKPPGWIKLAPKSQWVIAEDRRSILVPMRINWWHPGWVLALIKDRLGR